MFNALLKSGLISFIIFLLGLSALALPSAMTGIETVEETVSQSPDVFNDTAELMASSGTCGENLTWTLDDNGTLTISGTGKMTVFEYSWQDFSEDIKNVVIKDGVTSISDFAFYYHESLTSVIIPDSITTVGDCAFSCCTSLESISVDKNNKVYSSDEYGVLYNKDKTTLIQYPLGKERTSFTIPDSVASIGDWAFRDCTSLQSIEIPDSVTSIGDRAFRDCTSLESVVIPNSVTSIGDWAFSGCESLKNVKFNGSEKRWQKVTIDTGNDYLLYAEITFLDPVKGDLDGDDEVTLEDAIYLLQYSMFPEDYPLDNPDEVDYFKDGNIDLEDAIYLLQHSMFPEDYPIE